MTDLPQEAFKVGDVVTSKNLIAPAKILEVYVYPPGSENEYKIQWEDFSTDILPHRELMPYRGPFELNKPETPSYYGGSDNPYEAIKVIEAWRFGFNLGSLLKYISRAGKKPGESRLKDLVKARFYLQREIDIETKRQEQE